MVVCNEASVAEVRRRLSDCVKLLEHYDWLINSFVLDFFLDSHWSHLPASWQPVLSNITPAHLAQWLDPGATPTYLTPWPLSLLALKQSIKALSLDRSPVEDLHLLKQFLASQNKEHKQPFKNPQNPQLKEKPLTNSPDTNFQTQPASGLRIILDQTQEAKSSSSYTQETPQNSEETPSTTQEASFTQTNPWQFEPSLLSEAGGCQAGLKHVFRKHVKPKKQYEMCRLARLLNSMARSQGVDRVLDIGAGVGHLSRYLAYNYHLQVACVDGDGELTSSARKFDCELELRVAKMARRGETGLQMAGAPVHVTAHIAPDMDLDKFHQILTDKFSLGLEDELNYSLVGLHTCGDLGPVILNMFTQDKGAAVVVSVGCCYMKLKEHFPMSRFLSGLEWPGLSYVTEELACHAIETYTHRLSCKEENEKLKVHCYRAVLEKLLVSRSSQYRHTTLKTVPRAHTLAFPDYVARATEKLVSGCGLEPFTEEELGSPEVLGQLDRWWEIVTFYTLRLAMAPVIETVILLDRMLFLLELGHDSLMLPLFDPLLSPRNQVIVAVKNVCH